MFANWKTRDYVIAGVVALVLMCGGAALAFAGFSYLANNQQTARVEAFNGPDAYNAVPYAQAQTCGSDFDLLPASDPEEYVYGYSYPDTTIFGDIDVKVNGQWVRQYDEGGVGQFNTLRNSSGLTLEIRGHYGAGCVYGTDQEQMVRGEIDNPNHTDLVEVRDVLVLSDGTLDVTYFDRFFNVINK